MTALKDAPAPARPLLTTGWPQVDLLPQEIRDARRLRATQKRLGVLLLVIVLLALAGYAGSLFLAAQARADLAEAQAETQRLQGEQAKYAEVPLTLGQIAEVEGAMQVGTSTEVLWAPYLSALQAVTPAGVTYDSVITDAGSPMAPWAGSASELQLLAVGQITFTARAASLPDTAAWTDALSTVPGFSNPWFTTATLSDEDGAVFFQVSGTVDIVSSAYANRFATATEDPS
ncbi:PilN domain-containing protein [Cellulomonas sp. Marseille-Q8402]